MNFLNKFKDRYNIIILILSLLMFILGFRLAVLTIAEGDEYRYISDNKRIRDVETTAPRGEIRDRNGRLLAGNVSSFTVQLYKDEINRYDDVKEKSKKNLKKNAAFLDLIRLLEEDGVEHVDDYPIEMNTFAYKDENDIDVENRTAMDKVVDIILEQNMVERLLNGVYIGDEYPEHFDYIVANRALTSYRKKGIFIPIETKIIDGQLYLEFVENEDIPVWKSKNGIAEDANPMQSLVSIIGDDNTIIRSIINHPIARKLVYEILVNEGLESNIILEEFSISHEKKYIEQKRELNKLYPEITMDTKAVEDFVIIFKDKSLYEFLNNTYEIEGERRNKQIIPGEILIDLFKEEDLNIPITINKSRDKKSFEYEYTGDNKPEGDIVELLIGYAEEAKILEKFVSHEDIKGLAQKQLLKDGINPNISVSSKDIEYTHINNLNAFYTENGIKEKDREAGLSHEELLEKLKETYNIDKNLSKYEVIPILNIYDQMRKQGYLAYAPITLAYGINDTTVAKLEEALMEVPGISISSESVRYYPEGKSAAHILGYLGKISTPDEIEYYIEEKGYSKNMIIGKTGIEESMEETLVGTTGYNKVEIDSVGNAIERADDDKKSLSDDTKKAVPGDNLYLTIDLGLQQVAEDALERTLEGLRTNGVFESEFGDHKFNGDRGRPMKNATSGGVVVLDVKTGEVLASASNPSYDPNLFSTGISTRDWANLFPEDEEDSLAPRPLYNIITQTSVQPGSVYKMATALTALEKGLSPEKTIRDGGYVQIGESKESRMRCLIWTMYGGTHGDVNVYKAIGDSCNYYFYTLAMGRNQRTGEALGTIIDIDDIVEMSTKLGLNDKTGIEINIPAERSGGVPDPNKKIATTKAMLRNFLKGNIHHAYKEDVEFTEEEKEEMIEEICSWTEEEEAKSRGQVVNALDEMGLNPERIIPDQSTRQGLADWVKYGYMNEAAWSISDTLNITIGQGQGQYTPIQMANYISIIANGGYRHKLTLIDSVRNYNNSKTIMEKESNPERLDLNNYDNLAALREGMRLAAADGTATQVFGNFPVDVGVKTGTAQKDGINPSTGEKYDDFSWFVGFAPFDDPEIAVASLIFQGGSGYNGAPMVREIMGEYLGLNKMETKDNLPYKNFLSR